MYNKSPHRQHPLKSPRESCCRAADAPASAVPGTRAARKA
eukprot:CAMPEP_0204217622 /NCGR_PEP_ID=MMETSP0361-20130328/79031_1 /ASSEMBLY_ACC=CAM_ASM_000343 /TAXON_ID=268821 /ORGANISM="Scrippsiella Hangoei, Strain SHTV-5" /LENGTH=39 /DNA_ID= /DNA_START= /DNA_END= /DNA_ORIENTATION=